MSLILILILLNVFLDKGETYLWINSNHHPLLDHFFYFVDLYGNGISLGVLLFISLLISLRYAYLLALIIGIQVVLVNLFKKGFAADWPRPIEYFSGAELYLVPGVHVHHWDTFPSGHTVTAFTISIFLSFMTRRVFVRILLIGLACMTGLARIYLSQHFLVDVSAGILLAMMTAYVAVYVWIRTGMINSSGALLPRVSQSLSKYLKPIWGFP